MIPFKTIKKNKIDRHTFIFGYNRSHIESLRRRELKKKKTSPATNVREPTEAVMFMYFGKEMAQTIIAGYWIVSIGHDSLCPRLFFFFIISN